MSFQQFQLTKSINQSRDIFDKYIYEPTNSDVIADILVDGYFEQSRYADDPDWIGGVMEISAPDGFAIGRITDTGIFSLYDSTITPTSSLTVNQVPKADADGNLAYSGATVDPVTGEWTFDKSINVPVSSIKFTDAYRMSSGGDAVVLENIQEERFSRVQMDDMSILKNPKTIIPRTSTGPFIFQPIDADELTDPLDVPITVPALGPLLGLGTAEDGQTVLIADLKLTPESVKTNITITIKVNGTVFATSFYPTIALFEAPNIYRFVYAPPWDVHVGDMLEVTTLSSDGPMIFLGRADTQQKWSRGVIQLWDNKKFSVEDGKSTTQDDYTRLNDNYTDVSAATSGTVSVYLPTATTDTAIDFVDSTATTGGTGATCQTTGSDTFTQGDIILITNSRLNGGYYEVEDHTGQVLEIRGNDGTATVEGWSDKDFIHDSTGILTTITKVNVSVIRSGVDGNQEYGKGSVTGIEFSKVGIENGTVETLLVASSLASNQDPTGLGVVNTIQVEFGAAQFGPTDPVQIDVAGVVTFNESGLYRMKISAQIGRTGAGGVSEVLLRAVLNSVQVGRTVPAKLDNANVIIPYAEETWINIIAPSVLTFEVMRDDSGMNFGGLVGQDVTVEPGSWFQDSCAELRIDRWRS